MLGNKHGIVDENGKEITPIKYDYIDYRDNMNYGDNLLRVKLEDKWGSIDENGKEIIPVKYDDTRYFGGNLIAVKLESKWQFINKVSKEILPMKYNDVERFVSIHLDLAKVKLRDK